MTRDQAKKQILGLFLEKLSNDDYALFGPDGVEGEKDFPAFDGSRKELIVEFERRTGDPKRAIRGPL